MGSAVGGLLNGAVDWRTPARTRLPRLAATLGVLLIAAGASPDIVTLAALLALAGAFVTPVITTSYLVAEETTAPTARTRAGAWINTAVNAGSSAGAAGAGLLLARAPLGVCFAAAGAVALVAGREGLGRSGGRGRRVRDGGRGAEVPAARPASARLASRCDGSRRGRDGVRGTGCPLLGPHLPGSLR
ncbi:hypothetical protein F3K43_13320 [Streptomyces sp. LBUM 1476]|nr:hypothetical protein [Streptomyces sp. LBUM 1476]